MQELEADEVQAQHLLDDAPAVVGSDFPSSNTGRSIHEKPGWNPVHQTTLATSIRRMEQAGITPVMITGDNRRTAQAVADEVGIARVLAEVLPEDKAAEVRHLQEEGQRVMMVGDGINDAPALTQADVGMAIGAGTDIALESADIVIMSEGLGAVMDARDIGVRSYAKTKQNLGLAFAFNGIGVPAAATGLVHPIWAMVAMVASVTAVLGNSFAGRMPRRARGGGAPEPEQLLEEQHRREHDQRSMWS